MDVDTPATTSGRLLNCASVLCLHVYDPRMLAFTERAVALYRELDDRPGLANALATMSQIAQNQGRSAEASDFLLEAQHLLAGSNLRKSQLRVTAIERILYYERYDFPSSIRNDLEALALATAVKSYYEMSLLNNLGRHEFMAGNVDGAIERSRAACRLWSSRSESDRRGWSLEHVSIYLNLWGIPARLEF